MQSVGVWWMWLGFFIFVTVVFFIDVFALGGRRSHRVTTKEALLWSIIWVICALIFDAALWFYLSETGPQVIANQKCLEFLTGYIIEKSLSVDNLFVFLMIFNYFAVPAEFQRKVLLYGVFGAIIMRFIMIVLGTWLISELHWLLYLFGAFLMISGLHMLFVTEDKIDFSKSFLLQWLYRHLRITKKYHKERLFIRQNTLLYATPLFLVLIFIEASDLVFAIDSIPAIFAITLDPFIVFTSNIFAILGLRALYFLLAEVAHRFHLLKYGIAIVLTFIGMKMLIEPWLHIPTLFSLAIVVTIMATSIIIGALIKPRAKSGSR